MLVLGISFLVPLALFRVPWLTVQQLSTDTFSPKAVVKGLFAQAITGNIEQQNNIDEQFLNEQTTENRVKPVSNWQDGQRDANACLSSDYGWSEEELKEGLQEVKGGGLVEDFGRYIGFGWKEFAPGNGTYALMKLLFPTSDHCYGTNTEAKLLCANSEAIDNFQVATLKKLYAELPDKASEGAVLLKEALDAFDLQTRDNTTAYEAQAFRDQIVALRQYYQSHSIKSTAEVLAIPYRYIVPVNIVFNWSLQNLSSYYTDIGFARILMFILLVVSLPYALVKREKNLIVLSCTTLL
ncbi:MAG: hypothetical protein LBU27_02165 [Candidatus Peribacteria bacterium]|nr:hypothetical protein [Candidatus Peribacteria bacterium]